MHHIASFLFRLSFILSIVNPLSAEMVTFEGLLANSNSFVNGGPTTNTQGFLIEGARFSNSYDSNFGGFWSGWSYSNVMNTTVQSFTNQYAAWPGSGSNGSSSFGVAYIADAASGAAPTTISFASPVIVASADFANTTWTALTLQNGDAFSKKFGGDSGNDPDYLLVSIEGRTGIAGGGSLTGTIDFLLSDYRSANNALDFVRAGWNALDLTSLGPVQSLRFNMTTTDVGAFGPNTPLYFAIDNIQYSAVPEPTTLALVGMVACGMVRIRKRS